MDEALSPDSDEKQLCLNCLVPNNPAAHFCSKCGAPLSSYAATAPFERVFAEGFAYWQAVERPRKLIVLWGMWLMFGLPALAGIILFFIGAAGDFSESLIGLIIFIIPTIIIYKTTRNYFQRKQTQPSKTDTE